MSKNKEKTTDPTKDKLLMNMLITLLCVPLLLVGWMIWTALTEGLPFLTLDDPSVKWDKTPLYIGIGFLIVVFMLLWLFFSKRRF